MKLSASLALVALLAARDLAPAAARPPRDVAALARRLQRAESRGKDGAAPAAAPGRTGNLGQIHDSTDELGHLDTNTEGMTFVKDIRNYAYGDTIEVAFVVDDAVIDKEVLATLDARDMGDWKVGLYQRMENPGDRPPIREVTPTFDGERRLQPTRAFSATDEEVVGAEGNDADEFTSLGSTAGGRGGGPGRDEGGGKEAVGAEEDDADEFTVLRPGEDGEPAEPAAHSGDDSGDDSRPDPDSYQDASPYEDPDGDSLGLLTTVTPPAFPVRGRATFTASDTSAIALNVEQFGTGFDVHLLTADNVAIVTPATFYMSQFEDKNKKPFAGVSGGEGAKTAADYDLVKFTVEQSRTAPAAAAGPQGQSVGPGPGPDDAPLIATAESLATYTLESDKLTYRAGETVRVTYDVRPGQGARRLRATAAAAEFGANVVGSGGGKGAGGAAIGAGAGFTATDGRGGNGDDGTFDAAPGRDDNDRNDKLPPDVPDAVTTTTTLPPLDDRDEDAAATTTTVATVDMAASDPDASEFLGAATAEDPALNAVDPSDPTGYKIAVLMRMARALGQGNIKAEVPLCAGGAGACAPASVLTGTVGIQVDDLDRDESGTGYSVWVLDAANGEVAGPLDFYLAA